jgi:hypothetical protein
MGTVEVTVELADQTIDLSQVKVQLEGKTDAGDSLNVSIDKPTGGVFRKVDVPAGTYSVNLVLPEV